MHIVSHTRAGIKRCGDLSWALAALPIAIVLVGAGCTSVSPPVTQPSSTNAGHQAGPSSGASPQASSWTISVRRLRQSPGREGYNDVSGEALVQWNGEDATDPPDVSAGITTGEGGSYDLMNESTYGSGYLIPPGFAWPFPFSGEYPARSTNPVLTLTASGSYRAVDLVPFTPLAEQVALPPPDPTGSTLRTSSATLVAHDVLVPKWTCTDGVCPSLAQGEDYSMEYWGGGSDGSYTVAVALTLENSGTTDISIDEFALQLVSDGWEYLARPDDINADPRDDTRIVPPGLAKTFVAEFALGSVPHALRLVLSPTNGLEASPVVAVAGFDSWSEDGATAILAGLAAFQKDCMRDDRNYVGASAVLFVGLVDGSTAIVLSMVDYHMDGGYNGNTNLWYTLTAQGGNWVVTYPDAVLAPQRC